MTIVLFFIPTSAFAYEVTLNPPPTSVKEDALVVFTGTVVIPCVSYTVTCIPEPAADVTVQIKDQITNKEISSAVTDTDGKFSANWNAEYRDAEYIIFAVAYTSPGTPHTSLNYTLSVSPQPTETIQLILEPPIPSTTANVGDTLTFMGRLEGEDVFDKQIILKVDGTIVTTNETNENGKFTLSWTPTKEGTYTINAEYVSAHIESTSYNVQILSPIQLEVKIITSQTNGVIPFNVKFDAKATGGKEPYDYSWTIDGETIKQQSFTKSFVNVGEYDVTLLVVDSLSKKGTAKVTILASNPPPLNPKIIQQPEKVKEGSEASFVADVKDLSRVKSYEWIIDGKYISTSNKVTYWFANDGSYVVLLNIIDTDGKTHPVSKSVSVLNVSPQITSNLQNYEIETGEELRVNVVYADPGKDDTFTIEFFIDDRGIGEIKQSSHDAIFSFGRPTPGTYQARVVVTDNAGDKDERNFSIVIKERFPIEIAIGGGVAAAVAGTVIVLNNTPAQPPSPNIPPNATLTVNIGNPRIEIIGRGRR